MPNPVKKYKKKIPSLDVTKLKTKERRISNIDPINGVTIEQLLDHVTWLSTQMKEARWLNTEQRTDAIHLIALRVYTRMQAGDVPNKNYDDFKSYLYRTCHNEFLHEKFKAKQKKQSITGGDIQPADWFSGMNDPATNAVYEKHDEEQDAFDAAIRLKTIKDIIPTMKEHHRRVLEVFLANDKEGKLAIPNFKVRLGQAKAALRHQVFRYKPPATKKTRKPHKDWSHLDMPFFIKLKGARKAHNWKVKISAMPDLESQVAYLAAKGVSKPDALKILKAPTLKQKILALRTEGKTYKQIVKILGCTKSTVSYHLNENVREAARQSLRRWKQRRKNSCK